MGESVILGCQFPEHRIHLESTSDPPQVNPNVADEDQNGKGWGWRPDGPKTIGAQGRLWGKHLVQKTCPTIGRLFLSVVWPPEASMWCPAGQIGPPRALHLPMSH